MTVEETEPRFAKLPKWAQQEIVRLERDVQHHERRLAEVSGETSEPSNVEVNARGIQPGRRFLPSGDSVRFWLDPDSDGRARRYVDVAVIGGEVRVMTSGYGNMLVVPQASNVVYIGEQERHERISDLQAELLAYKQRSTAERHSRI
jgi:hypothetical protein